VNSSASPRRNADDCVGIIAYGAKGLVAQEFSSPGKIPLP
jgi:hypothetical protein